MEAARKTALLLGDITGKGRVGVRMLTAALEARGREVLSLPTALISNMLFLGAHEALDTTDYLLRTLDTWKALGVGFDLLYIGYLTGLAQARSLVPVADEAKARGVSVLVDPILGDGGRRYRSVSDDQLAGMALLARHATLITPNLTEACLLTDTPFEAAAQEETVWRMIDRLGGGTRSVLVTSARMDGAHAVLGWDAQRGERIALPYEQLPGKGFGTGDLFCALLADALLSGAALEDAARRASDGVVEQIRLGEKGLLE